MTPFEAYEKACEKGYSKELEEITCQEPMCAYYFIIDIPGADILYCTKHIIKDKNYAKYLIQYKPEYIELLKNNPDWKELIDHYLIENILK